VLVALMNFELQPYLQNDLVILRPLLATDFDALYQVASDPLIWEQHPSRNRYQKDVFETFFKGALESRGAFIVLDHKSQEVIGSSRYYELDIKNKSVFVGYTFLARQYWGTSYNRAMKIAMLDHAFRFVNDVFFHIGVNNIRSQTAIERLGAKQVGQVEKIYYGEQKNLNFVYRIDAQSWAALRGA
jgi:RimJ/RimL family protein N-acetyltransferase